jgi:small subunit ribosomal protein S6
MRLYELTVIIDSSLDESSLQSEIEKIENRITGSGGKIHKLDRWGVKRLAYVIDKHSQGYYAFFLFESEPGLTMELERNMRINENVLRFLTVSSPGLVPEKETSKSGEKGVETDEAESLQE